MYDISLDMRGSCQSAWARRQTVCEIYFAHCCKREFDEMWNNDVFVIIIRYYRWQRALNSMYIYVSRILFIPIRRCRLCWSFRPVMWLWRLAFRRRRAYTFAQLHSFDNRSLLLLLNSIFLYTSDGAHGRTGMSITVETAPVALNRTRKFMISQYQSRARECFRQAK